MGMENAISSAAKTFSVILFAFLIFLGGQDRITVSAQESEPVPYLLVATQNTIHRVHLNGTTDTRLRPSITGNLKKIVYHYGRNYMFWIDGTGGGRHRIVKARLNGTGTIAPLIGLSDPVDLAMDWLNDKLYWVDKLTNVIEEYDLVSGRRNIIYSTGTASSSTPSALAIYPYPNYGWLYWSDSTKNTIEMVSVTGDGHTVVLSNAGCVGALSIDYSTHTLYWITCQGNIQRMRLFDSSTPSTILSGAFFPSSLTSFNNTLYYATARGAYKYDLNGGSGGAVAIRESGSRRSTGCLVVHPSLQPPAETYLQAVSTVEDGLSFTCASGCVNGDCIPPGLCACSSGWKGISCQTDIQECALMNGGCEQSCTELEGGFECSCSTGYVLADDKRSCVEGCQTEVVTMTAVRPAASTFDPCTTYITPYSSILTTGFITSTSSIQSTRQPTSTVIVSSDPVSSVISSPAISSSAPAPVYTTIAIEPTSTSSVALPVPQTSIEPQSSSTQTYTVESSKPVVGEPRPSSTSTSKVSEPTPEVAAPISKDSDDDVLLGLGLYALIGIAAGLGIAIIIVIIALVVMIVLCIKYRRKRNRSWSPQKSFKDIDINIDSMVPVKPTNGHSNGKVVPISKVEEAKAELDEEPLEYIENTA